MVPMWLYPSITTKTQGGGGSVSPADGDGNVVFRNGERLELGHDVNGSDEFWKEFRQPFYRIPSMVITDTGRIVVGCDYRSKPNDQTAILPAVAYSDDNGKTWKKKIIDLNPTHLNAYYRIMDQTMFYYLGVIHIICGKWNGTANNVNWTQTANDQTWSVNHYYSSDNGETWTKQENFQRAITKGSLGDRVWLGGVGNSATLKPGRCLIPIQIANSDHSVEVGCLRTQDGINFNYYSDRWISNCSETSVAQIINSSGNSEIVFISRRDPNTPQSKSGKYIVVNANGDWDSNNFRDYGTYNDKIPARGSSGCQGSAISNHIGDTRYGINQAIMVSYAENFLNGTSAYARDNIVIGLFAKTNTDNSSIKLRELERIDLGAGAFVDGVPYGGYSMLYFNPICKKIGIAYESMGGIKYKDLSYYIPQLTGYTME